MPLPPYLFQHTQVLDDPRFDIILSKISAVVHDDTHYQKGALNIRTQKCFCLKSGINSESITNTSTAATALLPCCKGYSQCSPQRHDSELGKGHCDLTFELGLKQVYIIHILANRELGVRAGVHNASVLYWMARRGQR